MDNQPSDNAGEPLAFFLTWTTYGSWLPGDERGWTRAGKPGTEPPSRLFVEMARSEMKATAYTLSSKARALVESTIRRHCEIRGWALHSVNARTNHVHVVVTAASYHPKTVRGQFKTWCTRRLKELEPQRSRFWTEGGSCRWINQEADLEAAMLYVAEAQDRKHRDVE
jgi:REP element-mobilizing transposase RayT